MKCLNCRKPYELPRIAYELQFELPFMFVSLCARTRRMASSFLIVFITGGEIMQSHWRPQRQTAVTSPDARLHGPCTLAIGQGIQRKGWRRCILR